MTDAAHSRLPLAATLVSVSVALVLVGLKLWALGESGALSVAASLADSVLDVLVSLGALATLLYAARPPDGDHAFGHSSAEDLFALGQAVFVAAMAGAIGWAAVARLSAPGIPQIGHSTPAIIAMALSVVLTLALVAWQRVVVARTGSRVVAADRLHYIGDLIPALGALVALVAAGQAGLHWLDSVVALAASCLLALGAWRIGRGAWDALMDRRADPEVIARIATLARNWPGVHGFHDLKTRTAGRRLFVHLHIELDGAQSLDSAHAIGAGLKAEILRAFPGADVIIHKDPLRPPRA